MGLEKYKVKDSDKEGVLSEPAFMKISRLRNAIDNFIVIGIIMLIIGGFGEYGFLKGLIFIFGGIIVWTICKIILNLIFNPILAALLNKYLKDSK